MSLQVLTSLYLQGHLSSQFPHPTLDYSHILHMYSRRTSVFLGLSAFANSPPSLCLENTFPPSHLFTYFWRLRIHLRCLYLKAPLPISLPSDYDKCLFSLLPQHSTVCVLWTNSSCKWKINLILLSSFSWRLSLTSSSSRSTLLLAHLDPFAPASLLFQKHTDNTNLGLLSWLFLLPRIYSQDTSKVIPSLFKVFA